MAISLVVSEQGKMICSMPQTAAEQIANKRNVEDNAEKVKAYEKSFQDLLKTRYINSGYKDIEKLEEAQNNFSQIYEALVFGFCSIDFPKIIELYSQKSGAGVFDELSKVLKIVADKVNNNESIRKYIESGITVKELVAQRMAEVNRIKKNNEQKLNQ